MNNNISQDPSLSKVTLNVSLGGDSSFEESEIDHSQSSVTMYSQKMTLTIPESIPEDSQENGSSEDSDTETLASFNNKQLNEFHPM
jgi:hypothetical protein